jgi:hypothetical protein
MYKAGGNICFFCIIALVNHILMIHFINNNPAITLELKVKPANAVYRIFILLLAAVVAMVAVGVLIFGEANPFLRILAAVVLGFFVRFLVRSLFWNTHGREIYEISPAEFSVTYDYGKFKSKTQTTPLPKSIVLFYIDTEYPQTILPLNNDVVFIEKRDYKIVFNVDGTAHHSVVEHSKEDMQVFMKLLPDFEALFPATILVVNS